MNQVSASWDVIQIRGKILLILGTIILIPVYLFAPFVFVQFVCIFLLFILLGSRFYTEYLIRKIRVKRRDAELRVFRHEWVQVKLWAENHGALPAFMLIMGDTPGNLSVFKNRKTLCTLRRRSRSLITWQGYCSERGIFTLGPVVVRGADPLGLFPFQLSAYETSRLFVYPAFRSIRLKAPGGIPLGNMIAFNPLFEDITRCRSLRPYYPGDEPRRINWKVSARMSHAGTFMINEYEATASHPLMVFLNLNQNEYPPKKQKMYFERIIEAAAALCLQASREQQELGIVIFYSDQEGGISVIAPAAFTLIPILERLAALRWVKPADQPDEPSGENYFSPADDFQNVKKSENDFLHLRSSARAMLDQGKHLPYGTRFLYTGPDLGDEAYISLNSLKKHHLTLEYLIIDEQTLLPLVPGNSLRYQMQERGYEIIENG